MFITLGNPTGKLGYYITPSVQRAEVSNVAPSERRYSHCRDAVGEVRDGRKYCRKELVMRRRQVAAAHHPLQLGVRVSIN